MLPILKHSTLYMEADSFKGALCRFINRRGKVRERRSDRGTNFVQYMANQFWTRWRREYCTLLHKRQKWNTPQRNSRVEDIVIIQDDNLPRDRWPLAMVTKLYPSKDGLIRKVQLFTAETLLERPIRETKLVLLLAQEETTEQDAIPVRGASAADGWLIDSFSDFKERSCIHEFPFRGAM